MLLMVATHVQGVRNILPMFSQVTKHTLSTDFFLSWRNRNNKVYCIFCLLNKEALKLNSDIDIQKHTNNAL